MANEDGKGRPTRIIKMVTLKQNYMIQIQIANPYKGLILYEPRNYQKQLLDALNSEKNVQLYSARQMGVSTTLMYFILNKCIEVENTKCLLIYPNNDSATQWLNQYKNAASSKIKSSTKNLIEFENGSTIQFLSVRSNYIEKGYSKVEIFVEYFQFMDEKYFDEFMVSVDSTCKVRFFSCPGVPIDGYEQMKWNYTLNTEFNQPDWVSKQKEILGESLFNNEYVIN